MSKAFTFLAGACTGVLFQVVFNEVWTNLKMRWLLDSLRKTNPVNDEPPVSMIEYTLPEDDIFIPLDGHAENEATITATNEL